MKRAREPTAGPVVATEADVAVVVVAAMVAVVVVVAIVTAIVVRHATTANHAGNKSRQKEKVKRQK